MHKSVQMVAAKKFAERWKNKGYEKGESQTFWLELLQTVFEVERPYDIISFENQVKLSSTSFIDAYIEPTHVLIEQKSIDKNLRKPIPQSDGTLLTPFQQAKRYAAELPYSRRPRWMVICNFKEFHVYDMENPQGEPEVVFLENLETDFQRMRFLVENGNEHLQKEMEVSLKAGEIIGEIYDELLKQYVNPDDPGTLRSLNILCVRIVFCLYAEDAGLFGEKRCMFHDYLARFKPDEGDMRDGLIKLFETLNTPVEQRSPYLNPSLKAFPYCNGGLFSNREIEIPFINEEIARLLLKNASEDFDWSQISPTIFGAVFESTLNPETRRSGGMHYTSIENIHKVIDPLFLDELKSELAGIMDEPVEKKRIQKAREYQDKLASLKFLDPACGSGNFLTETYLSLRRLENEVMPIIGDLFNPIKVSIHQFYGIEINDFAVATATTAIWIAEAQMMMETEREMHISLDFLPLKSYNNIKECNALKIDWNDVVPAGEVNYIIGNPPFSGARQMQPSQRNDVEHVFGKKWKNACNLDYVCCWYKKAVDYIQGTDVRCALVSTNSVTQGEQVAGLWKPLMENYGVHIDFAWRTFRWDSEASVKAHVHCVIIGFSLTAGKSQRYLYRADGHLEKVDNINPYLIDADNVFIESRNKPISGVPNLLTGSQRIDNDNFMFDEEQKDAFVKIEPLSGAYFKKWYGAVEFLNSKPRWCLYLGKCSPSELRKMPKCLEIVERVKTYRLSSKRKETIKAAAYPNRFGLEVIPETNFMIVPVVSSEKRRYVPMGFMTKDNLCSNQVNLIPNTTLFHFGVLTSNVHMAWMRVICGRLKSDYRYSKDIVYNNFPWPDPTDCQKEKIEQTAQAILDARALYQDSSLADLYDETTMPPELRKAHQENDKAVMTAYGFDWHTMTESDCVAELFKRYQHLTM